MYHLFNRIYLGVDVLKDEQNTFFLASKALGENFDETLISGPFVMGVEPDEEKFVKSGFSDLIAKYKGLGDKKVVIYTSVESYGQLVAKWLKALFPNASSEQLLQLLNLEFLSLSTQGVPLPKTDVLKETLVGLSIVEQDPELRALVRDMPERVSLEYKLLDHLSGNKRANLADPIRVFALRSMHNHIDEIQRNLVSLFFSENMQKKYGYTAAKYLGDFDILRKIPRLNFLNDPNLSLRITRLKEPAQEAVLRDMAVYLDQEVQIEKTQIAGERAKLKIIDTLAPLSDDEVVTQFISMLRTSTEHTDYLDWADMDKLKVHVIHWAVTLTAEDCKGFEL